MRLLVPTDGSAASRRAIVRAEALGRALGAEVRLFPVLGPGTAAAICRRAEAEGADLVVVAGTPRWGGRLRLLGDVAEEVACRAPCSVLVEPPEAPAGRRPPPGRVVAGRLAGTARGPARIGSVLVAVDFSAASREALSAALRIAEAVGGRVDLLHALGPEPEAGRRGGASRPRLREAMERLGDAAAAARRRGIPAEAYLRRGAPARTIARFASEGCYDLLVLGAGGGSGAPDASLGGVAQELLARPPCPVMVVRETSRRRQLPARPGRSRTLPAARR